MKWLLIILAALAIYAYSRQTSAEPVSKYNPPQADPEPAPESSWVDGVTDTLGEWYESAAETVGDWWGDW